MSEHTAESDAWLHAIWREAAEKGIEHGIDWPRVVLDLFKALDQATAVADSMQHFADVAEVCERKSNEYASRIAAVEAIIGPDEVFPDWSQYPHRHRVTVKRPDIGAEVTTTVVDERAIREALKPRVLPPDEVHDFDRETSGQSTRAVCSCGNWHGQWRHPIDRRGLHSDEGEHIYAVRRAQAAQALPADPWDDGPVHHPTRFDLPMSADPPF